MIDDKFKGYMQAKTGCVVIMAGSGSDSEHILKITTALEKFNIPYDVKVCSAHKQPTELEEMIKEYNRVGGLVTYVAVAGGTDALSGTLSFHALGPVISCPPDAPNNSCLTNPPGSSNGYIGNPVNVAKFIAQMYAGINPEYNNILLNENSLKIKKLKEDDKNILKKLDELKQKSLEKK